MKSITIACFLLVATTAAFSQTEYAVPDSLARSIRKSQYDTPEALAKALCKHLKTDRDKARVIFTWIADNVRYDVKGMDREPPKNISQQRYEAELIERTFKKEKGVCMDYSLLYKTMAEAVGLECAFVSGHSRRRTSATLNSHAWNAVKIDGEWRLLDATWGAGYVEDGEDFHQLFLPGYFLTSPRVFALDHLPTEENWQLLDKPIDKETFKNQPYLPYGHASFPIVDMEPFGVPLMRAADGKMQLRLKFNQPVPTLMLKVGTRDTNFKKIEKDGWTTLEFSSNYGREVQLWGAGEMTKKGMETRILAVIPVK